MRIEDRPIDSIIPYARNPRKNDAAIAKVSASLKEFGWRQPVVVDPGGVIVAGHTRYLAAQKLGMETVPVHVAEGLSPAQLKAYRLMDNRSHEDSTWDDELLGLELEDLKGLDIDLSLTGFELEELGDYLGEEEGGEEDGETPIPEPLPVPVVQPGDVWLCGHHRVVCGDVRDKASLDKALNGRNAGMCVTSPPYWGLRDYGTASWEGGDEGCDHRGPPTASHKSTLGIEKGLANHEAAMRYANGARVPFTDICRKCGARRVDAQIGLEATPEEWTAAMVEVFCLVREALADDGTCWINLGDSYSGGGGYWPEAPSNDTSKSGQRAERTTQYKGRSPAPGLKPKDLCGMPWRLAFALQADGWYLRSDIIWHKPNPMPESVTDRPTRAHEYLFLLSKRARYYFDAVAIAEPAEHAGKEVKTNDGNRTRDGFRRGVTVGESRNRRDVWTIATQPYSEAHFATFPEALISPASLAGTSERGRCPCGARWRRETEVSYSGANHGGTSAGVIRHSHKQDLRETMNGVGNPGVREKLNKNSRTIGWAPACACALDPIPDLIFEPFLGAGTTMIVAEKTGRHCAGVELNPSYVGISLDRFFNLTGKDPIREEDGMKWSVLRSSALGSVA